MITEKDKKLGEEIIAIWQETLSFKQAGLLIYEKVANIRAESAEQARKEAADRVVEWVNKNLVNEHMPIMCKRLEEDDIRAVILSTPVKEGKTDAEKLAIAMKTLESVVSYVRDNEQTIRRMTDIVEAALKEIQR